jgi:uncharacterized repeat protein (TIGR01451 family)
MPARRLAYTLVVRNSGGATLTNIEVTDILPDGLNHVSTSVTRPVNTSTTYADNFNTNTSWSGSTGATGWSAAVWTETDSGAAQNHCRQRA